MAVTSEVLLSLRQKIVKRRTTPEAARGLNIRRAPPP